jgi:hypothetical protein
MEEEASWEWEDYVRAEEEMEEERETADRDHGEGSHAWQTEEDHG